MDMATPRKKVDWEKIEAAYRAGRLSLREIGAEYGVSHVAINKKAKKEEWSRDLSAKIKAKADAMVTKAEVTGKVTKASEKEIVEANAQAILEIRLSHRKDIRRAKSLVANLFSEVENAVKKDDQEAPGEILTIPQRVDCVRKLTDSAKTLIGLEREAWGIKTDEQGERTPANCECFLPDHVLEMIGK